ncbi:MAG TPA: D-alanyl-D-alanine carboxypeptidase family protein [Lacunisphaera sp.]|nr:D-alanyl-D-alanine carboxypeptidase family protein [Lacunisphaera sp.]
MHFLRRIAAVAFLLCCLAPAYPLDRVARDPYLGAIVIDDASGRVLFEDNADARGYPASVTKLMTFFVVMDKVHAGQLTLDTPITVSAEASRTGGSQVYLKQGEVFTVDELLYALMIQSANDAAVALAVHAAGSKEAFVELMNAKARQLGMTNTAFQSPHGLPPGKGQQVDLTTPRDLAILSRELIDHGDILRYTSVAERSFREKSGQPFIMRNHNHLLGKLAGCDGLKTGYFSAAGYSLSATVERNGRRIIIVVMGSAASKTRDFKVMELTEKGFAAVPVGAPVVKTNTSSAPTATAAATPAAKPAASVPVAKPAPVAASAPTVKTVKTDKAPEQSSTPTEPMFKVPVLSPQKKP